MLGLILSVPRSSSFKNDEWTAPFVEIPSSIFDKRYYTDIGKECRDNDIGKKFNTNDDPIGTVICFQHII